MATSNGCSTAASARRLSDLLREQQEPFLLLHLLLQDHDDDSATSAAAASAARRRKSLLRGSTAATVTKLALRWADDLLAGCCFSFPCATATRQRLRFRRLPRADHGHVDGVVAPAADHYHGGGAVHCGKQQLSPVSVLDMDLHSGGESSPYRDEPSHSDDDVHGNGKPSTSAGTGTMTSPPSPPSTSHDHDLPGKTPAMEPVERFQRKSVIAFASAWEWESVVAADISRIPGLVVELDFSESPRDDWRRLVLGGGGGGEEEARQVARSIEAMIFEEVRWEAVRDMLSLCDKTDSSWVC